MRSILFAILSLVLFAGSALAQSTKPFTTVDQYGHVSVGTVQQQADGSQSYTWTNPYTGKTDTGYVSPDLGNEQRNYSTYDAETGKANVGSIYGVPESGMFLPTNPSDGQPSCFGCYGESK